MQDDFLLIIGFLNVSDNLIHHISSNSWIHRGRWMANERVYVAEH